MTTTPPMPHFSLHRTLVGAVAAMGLLASVVLPGRVNGRALPRTEPESVGMSTERLARFDALARAAVDEGRLAGVVTLVARRGRVVQEGVYGLADLDDGRPMRPDTIFRIASMTKPVTSVAAMILVEEGRLLLEDPVARHLPAFADVPGVLRPDGELEPLARPITMLDLLSHRSGITYGGGDDALGDAYRAAGFDSVQINQRDESTSEIADRLATVPLIAQPGERFFYSFSTDVLGAVVEKVSGSSLDEFFRRRIFEPLEMKDTSFYLPPDKLDRLVATHTLNADGRLRRGDDDDMEWTGQGAFVQGPRRVFSGGGGLLTTAPDYARFLQMLLDGGTLDGVRLLSPSSVRLMTVNHVDDLYAEEEGFDGMGFGLGFEVKVEPTAHAYVVPMAASPGSYAWGGAAYTTFWVDPEQDLVAIFMAQLRPKSQEDLARRFGNLVYQALVEP